MKTHPRLAEVPVTIIKISLAILVLGQLLRLPTPIPGLQIHSLDITIALYLLFSAIILAIYRVPAHRHPLVKPYLILLVAIALSWIPQVWSVSTKELAVSLLYAFRILAYALVPITLPYLLTDTTKQNIKLNLLYTFMAIAMVGLLQYLFIPDLRFTYQYGWDDHLFRLTSTWLDPGFTGLAFVFGILYLAKKHLPDTDSFWSKDTIAMFILIVSLALTFSRASYLALITGLITLSVLTKKVSFPAVIAVLLLIAVIISPKPAGEGVKLNRTSTVNFRLQNWQQAILVSQDHFLTGVGFNRYRYIQPLYNQELVPDWQTSHSASGVDNSLLFIIATTGLIGFFLFTTAGYFMLQYLQGFTDFQITIPIAVAWLTHSMLHNSLFYIPIVFLFAIILTVSTTDKLKTKFL